MILRTSQFYNIHYNYWIGNPSFQTICFDLSIRSTIVIMYICSFENSGFFSKIKLLFIYLIIIIIIFFVGMGFGGVALK